MFSRMLQGRKNFIFLSVMIFTKQNLCSSYLSILNNYIQKYIIIKQIDGEKQNYNLNKDTLVGTQESPCWIWILVRQWEQLTSKESKKFQWVDSKQILGKLLLLGKILKLNFLRQTYSIMNENYKSVNNVFLIVIES